MEKYSENNANTSKFEEDIRKLATPYVSEEPGPLYWATFRVRVMDRIAEQQRTTWLERIQLFLAGHIWSSSIAISAAALLVAGVMIFQPFGGDAPVRQDVSSEPIAKITPAPSAPVAQVTTPESVTSPEVAAVQSPTRSSDRVHSNYRAKHTDDLSQTDLAMVAEPVSGPAENAVSLDDLSKPELEAIVQDLENDE
jgi:hypothetical protein